jgi:hypothetical protein
MRETESIGGVKGFEKRFHQKSGFIFLGNCHAPKTKQSLHIQTKNKRITPPTKTKNKIITPPTKNQK